ncbi:MAG: ABC transporter substrate-binding protein [Oscillospiraceae bacterium]|nr:ABC transporter substrate-binding protein [Oscillospiraceae bacterium]
MKTIFLKNILTKALPLCLALSLFCACAQQAVPSDVRVAVIKGTSSIGMIKLIDEVESGEIDTNNFTFEIFASPDEVVPKVVRGDVNIAAVPPNLAAVLYNTTDGAVRAVALGTLGMLYVVEKGDTIKSVEDLRGKTIYAGFKGKSPEYDLNYILKANGMEPEKDVNIEWKSEHSETVAALVTSEDGVAILPQPFVTTALMANADVKIALDLNEEWGKTQERADIPSTLITTVVVARADFIEQNPEAVNDFFTRYAASVAFVNGNVDEAAVLVEKHDIFPADVAREAIPLCNIIYIDGAEMKEKLSGYLNILFEQNPQSVGGSLPGEEFYFVK